MGVFSHIALLQHQKFHKSLLVIPALQRFEHLLLRLRHRTADTVTSALELAHINARARKFGHLTPLLKH